MNNVEKRIENRVGNIDMKCYNNLKELCQQVANFINTNCTPHTTVTISANDFMVREDVVNGFLED